MSKIINTDEFPAGRIQSSRKKLVIFGGAALAVIALISAGLYALVQYSANHKQDEVITLSHVCSDELIKRASSKIEANDLDAMEAIQKEIKSIKTYDSDANCVFILARYALMRNDAVTAREHLDRLKKVYVPYSTAFTTPTMTPDKLEEAIVVIEKTDAQHKKDASSADTVENANMDAEADKTGGNR